MNEVISVDSRFTDLVEVAKQFFRDNPDEESFTAVVREAVSDPQGGRS